MHLMPGGEKNSLPVIIGQRKLKTLEEVLKVTRSGDQLELFSKLATHRMNNDLSSGIEPYFTSEDIHSLIQLHAKDSAFDESHPRYKKWMDGMRPTAELFYQYAQITGPIYSNMNGLGPGKKPKNGISTEGTGKLTIPQGVTSEQFNNASSIIRQKVGSISDDIVVQGSRANGTARPDSDIDFAVRVSPEKFDELITQRFGTPNPGSAKERTMQHAIETGKIQSGGSSP